jgi:hypothetical protein
VIEYIKRLIQELSGFESPPDAHVYYPLFEAVVEEINRLDPRDFLPDAQFYFTFTRASLRGRLAHRKLRTDFDEVRHTCWALLKRLELYGGDGSGAVTRSFSFIADAQLRAIIERDYRELTLYLFPAGAWKSTVVMAGSILEALLHDALSRDPATLAAAQANLHAPQKPIEKWTLHQLIEVAAALDLIPQTRLKAIDQSLRDYRNYVHPSVEIRTGYPCTEAEALLAKGALDSVLNHLAPR